MCVVFSLPDVFPPISCVYPTTVLSSGVAHDRPICNDNDFEICVLHSIHLMAIITHVTHSEDVTTLEPFDRTRAKTIDAVTVSLPRGA